LCVPQLQQECDEGRREMRWGCGRNLNSSKANIKTQAGAGEFRAAGSWDGIETNTCVKITATRTTNSNNLHKLKLGIKH